MNNQEAKKWFENRLQSATMPAAREAFKAAVEAFDGFERMLGLETMCWISVKDRLPDNGTVLVTDGKIVVTAPSSSVTVDGPAISHWMPLPEPPEEKRNDIQ